LWVVPDLVLLSPVDNSGQELIDVITSVHISPEGFSVIRVITTTVGLFTSVVGNRDTNGGQSESQSGLESNVITVGVQESGVVVVIDEVTKETEIGPGTGTVVVALEVVHGVVSLENITSSEEIGIVQDTIDWSFISSVIRKVGVEHFTDSVDTSSGSEIAPEVLGDVWDSIDSQTVDVISGDETTDPGEEIRSHKVVVLVKIGELSQPAGLEVALVVLIDRRAVDVIVII